MVGSTIPRRISSIHRVVRRTPGTQASHAPGVSARRRPRSGACSPAPCRRGETRVPSLTAKTLSSGPDSRSSSTTVSPASPSPPPSSRAASRSASSRSSGRKTPFAGGEAARLDHRPLRRPSPERSTRRAASASRTTAVAGGRNPVPDAEVLGELLARLRGGRPPGGGRSRGSAARPAGRRVRRRAALRGRPPPGPPPPPPPVRRARRCPRRRPERGGRGGRGPGSRARRSVRRVRGSARSPTPARAHALRSPPAGPAWRRGESAAAAPGISGGAGISGCGAGACGPASALRPAWRAACRRASRRTSAA